MTNAAVRAAAAAARAARRASEDVADVIAREVYAQVVTIREDLAQDPESVLHHYPLWMLGPLQYVAQTAALIVVRQRRMPNAEVIDVAAYFFALLVKDAEGMIGSFDPEHYEKWRAGADPARAGADETPAG